MWKNVKVYVTHGTQSQTLLEEGKEVVEMERDGGNGVECV